MTDPNPKTLTWYADSDDPYHTFKRGGGGWMIGIAVALTAFAAIVAAGGSGPGRLAVVLVVGILVPVAICVVAWDWLRDRRAVVEIRLSPADRPTTLQLLRVNGATTEHPIGELSRVDVTRTEGMTTSTAMRLKLNGTVARTRYGPATLPTGWVEALAASGVEVNLHTKVIPD